MAYTCIDYDQRGTSIDFGVKRSKVTVIFGLKTFFNEPKRTPIDFWAKRLRLNWESVNLLPRRVSVPFRTFL